jgi:hypothetical protein
LPPRWEDPAQGLFTKQVRVDAGPVQTAAGADVEDRRRALLSLLTLCQAQPCTPELNSAMSYTTARHTPNALREKREGTRGEDRRRALLSLLTLYQAQPCTPELNSAMSYTTARPTPDALREKRGRSRGQRGASRGRFEIPSVITPRLPSENDGHRPLKRLAVRE